MALFGVIPWSLFVDACRLLSVCLFLITSLSLNWYSFLSIIALLISLYILDRNSYNTASEKPLQFPGKNPYKGKKRVKDEEKISPETKEKFVEQILDLVLYDVENCAALRNFDIIQQNTHCTFAKRAMLWGSRDYDTSMSLEQNVMRSLPALTKLLIVGDSLHLDGFLIELPGSQFGATVEEFGQGVRRVLKCISDHDPISFHCMNKSYLGKVGWSFEYGGVPIFVTTFAPCYPENHSRYAFGSENSYILLQPMYSFAIHDIGDDTPLTNWDEPKTVRDKIRCAYKENNRGYYIRDTVVYPAAHDVVKPLKEGPGHVIEWWMDPSVEEGHGEESGQSDSDSEDSESVFDETEPIAIDKKTD
ncbi:uncharacterized protein LOC135334087 [Halichondria panicea]|uniref:uncharacterized protein LOC135334087 n=1 Tax=Halichondria panicea TaxID=6063 RepID=UPI00312B6CD6